ncbi:MAG: rod shape-determining protein MreC [Patescibacteria group bacterium]
MKYFGLKIVLLGFICGAAFILFFFGKTLESKAAAIFFKKIKAVEALGFSPATYNFFGLLKSKGNILRENQELKEKLQESEAKADVSGFASLTAGQAEKSVDFLNGFLEARVLMVPPAIDYDQLIVGKGAQDGVESGKIVLVGQNIIFGTVGDVFSGSSRIISFSSYGREQNVFLEKAGISATATGRGNNELAVTLPRDFPAEVGDKAYSMTDRPYLVGLVEKIEAHPSSPIKTLKIRQPFNIYNLRSVNILK